MANVNDFDLSRRLRHNILDVLELWASKNAQLEYQKNVPIAQVSSEIFNQWDDFYYPDTEHFLIAFNEKERKALANFNETINSIADKTETYLPDISAFIKTDEWRIVNKSAIEAIKNIMKERVGNK